jgi:uncharacterized membrane protein YfcA
VRSDREARVELVSIGEAIAILAAGMAAGAVNTIVGSGSLITFPTLLAFGYAPVVANVSNTVGLVPGSLSGAIGYRRELRGQRSRVLRLGAAALLGGLSGGILLLALPATAFERVVPYLILVACLLVAAQPMLSRALAHRNLRGAPPSALLLVAVYVTGIYGGYFGAAQSVMLIALLGILLPDDLQRLNALKNVLTLVVNGIAAALFIVLPLFLDVPRPAWEASLFIAIGAIAGGQIGAAVGRRMPQAVLRGIIVVVGSGVAIKLLLG